MLRFFDMSKKNSKRFFFIQSTLYIAHQDVSRTKEDDIFFQTIVADLNSIFLNDFFSWCLCLKLYDKVLPSFIFSFLVLSIHCYETYRVMTSVSHKGEKDGPKIRSSFSIIILHAFIQSKLHAWKAFRERKKIILF